MGIIDRLFRRPPKETKYAYTTNGYAPVYPQWGDNVYASDAVQQALKCIVDEVKKLKPTHIRAKGNDPTPVQGSVQKVLSNPNPLMTTSEFLEKVTWLLLLNYNAFIIPVYKVWYEGDVEKREYLELYPIKPTQVNFIEDATNKLYVQFYFANGNNTTIPYSDVIHLKYNYSVGEYMGGNELGQPDNSALKSTLALNHKLLQGIAKAMDASYAVNGIIKYNTVIDAGKMDKAIQEFNQRLRDNESGFLPIDLKAELQPFERKSALVDKPTLEFIDSKILRNWGVPLPILTGDYTKAQYEAFYQKVLEPLAICYSQAFTKKMFTGRERAFGNRIEFYPKDLIFLSMEQTLKMIDMLSPTGGLFENEKRVALGLPPLPELEGKRYMSLNWIDAANADQYQVGKNVNVDIVDENKTEE